MPRSVSFDLLKDYIKKYPVPFCSCLLYYLYIDKQVWHLVCKRQHPPGNFLEIVKSPAPGPNFVPLGQKSTHARELSSQPFLLIGVEILGFCRNQTLKRIERLSNYSLVIPSSFSSSTMLYHSKVFPQL